MEILRVTRKTREVGEQYCLVNQVYYVVEYEDGAYALFDVLPAKAAAFYLTHASGPTEADEASPEDSSPSAPDPSSASPSS